MRKTIILLAVVISAYAGVCSAYTSPGTPVGHVNDFAQVLSEEAKVKIENQLTIFTQETTSEIAVVTVPSIGDDYIENYTEKLFKEWGVGSAKNDNGILLLLSIQDRKLRIEVGYGLEGAIPDSVANRIITDVVVPKLKSNDYDGAVTAGVSSLIEAARGEYTADTTTTTNANNDIFQVLFFFGIFGLQWFAAILGKTKEWWLGGVLGFAGGSTLALFNPFGFSLLAYGAIIAGLTAFGAFFDYIVSSTFNHAQSHGYSSPWWIGGNGGNGSSGGGFGGFGGGSSGGGGASGSW